MKKIIRNEELECKKFILQLLRDKGINFPKPPEDVTFLEMFLLTSEDLTLSMLQIIEKRLQKLFELQNKYSESIPYFKGLSKKLQSLKSKDEVFWKKNMKYCGVVYDLGNKMLLSDAYVLVKDSLLLDDMLYISIDADNRTAKISCISFVGKTPEFIKKFLKLKPSIWKIEN